MNVLIEFWALLSFASIKVKRCIRNYKQKRTCIKKINEWWRKFIAECEEAENPMRLY